MFKIFIDKAGRYRFNLYAANGQKIATSVEGRATKAGILNTIMSIKKNSYRGKVVDENGNEVEII